MGYVVMNSRMIRDKRIAAALPYGSPLCSDKTSKPCLVWARADDKLKTLLY